MHKIDLHIEQSANATFTFTLKDITGAILDLTDKIVTSEIKISSEYKDALFTPFVMVADAANGQVVWMLDAADTQKLKSPEYEYDIMVNDRGVVHRVIQGKIFTEPGVTRT